MLIGQALLGLGLLVSSYLYGIRIGSFHAHILFPLGFWLLFDACDCAHRGTSLLHSSSGDLLGAILFGSLAGVFLDFHMVIVTGILRFLAVTNVLTALEMYLGWGLSLAAIYESYQVFLNLGIKVNRARSEEDTRHLIRPFWHRWGVLLFPKGAVSKAGGLLAGAGFLLVAIPLFMRMYHVSILGWLIILSFTGFWFILEGIIARQGRSGLLALWLEGHWWPLFAILPPALIFCLAWEGLNGLMGSWSYQNIFWLEPKIWNVPLVAIFGYIFWYILFLSGFQAIWGSTFSAKYRIKSSRRSAQKPE